VGERNYARLKGRKHTGARGGPYVDRRHSCASVNAHATRKGVHGLPGVGVGIGGRTTEDPDAHSEGVVGSHVWVG
jgi:hypothetical protein